VENDEEGHEKGVRKMTWGKMALRSYEEQEVAAEVALCL
jgi:hypothetical protein